MKYLIPLILGVSVIPTASMAEPSPLIIRQACVNAEQLNRLLKEKYGPAPILRGESGGDTFIEIWATRNGEYVIVLLLNGEVSCIFASGSGLNQVKPPGKEL